ncbi:MAG TPA: hypothetical protein VE870_17505 [Bacteroidales bacterium]|nr:hypothetical protein [Bacteroidales bacterium]
MKTKIIHIVCAIAIMAIGTNVYADNTKGKKEKKAKAEKIIHKIENKFDQELHLENWMMELRTFSGKELITEENLQFESWMMSEFTVSDNTTFQEKDIEFEPWMMTTFNSQDKAFQEEALEFEPWMLKKFK